MPTPDTPVLIVGAGAAGTVLALELARRGTDLRWIDRLPGPTAQSRAITVHARTLELLEAVDPRLVQRFLDRGIASPGYVMHYVDEAGTRQVVRPGLDFRGLPSRYPFLLLHPQDETEATLRQWIAEQHDRRPEWGVTCLGVEQADGPWRASPTTSAGCTTAWGPATS
jgi:2-polyprenyl-6-methoxyphenol hydroxylase-like FAD-dependent oxidoreductase